MNTSLSTRVSSLKDLLQEAKSQNTCANLGVKLANLKVKEMEVEAAHAQKELLETKLDLDAQVCAFRLYSRIPIKREGVVLSISLKTLTVELIQTSV